MIYVDTSVALAYLLGETRRPDASLWDAQLVSSRLLEYEVWNRLHVHELRMTESGRALARKLLGHVVMLDLSQDVLARALLPFPVPARTLDALHLATMEFLRAAGHGIELASYDFRLVAGAKALGIKIADL